MYLACTYQVHICTWYVTAFSSILIEIIYYVLLFLKPLRVNQEFEFNEYLIILRYVHYEPLKDMVHMVQHQTK